jgi:uncharacterized membrane-anchored protein
MRTQLRHCPTMRRVQSTVATSTSVFWIAIVLCVTLCAKVADYVNQALGFPLDWLRRAYRRRHGHRRVS